MKIVGLSIVRTGSDLQDPVPLTMACDLSSYGFFQRQVSATVLVLETDIIMAENIIGRTIRPSRTYLAFNSTVHCSRLTSGEELCPVPPQCDTRSTCSNSNWPGMFGLLHTNKS